VACTDDRVMVKLGPQQDMGDLVPSRKQGWHLCASGKDFAVWENTDK
jgi:hypothetical protein